MVRLVHGLIATSSRQKSILTPEGIDRPVMPLPSRLIEIGLSSNDPPRLVHTAGQTGTYVALSHVWPTLQTTKLTKSTLPTLEKNIDTSESRELRAAIHLTRLLGVRYLWIDTLCIFQDNEQERCEALLNMKDIYFSSVATISLAVPEMRDSPLNVSLETGPLSIILPRTQPQQKSTVEKCLQMLSSCSSRKWTLSEAVLSDHALVSQTHFAAGVDTYIEWIVETTFFEGERMASIDDESVHHDGSQHNYKDGEGGRYDRVNNKIDEGINDIERGHVMEALASFMAAKDIVNMIKPSTARSDIIVLTASAAISKVYLMQNLPATGLSIAQTALEYGNGLAVSYHDIALE